ncbi:metallophosphoesterase [Enterococcus termitis]|uniref:Calcineurin-like phosphoesterase domain-containing protein n=1 Tax=Enterococcus termitis TaxID=332950 RepID=A0A1E5GDC1_9ENTE|nr:metallophosphoesterase [Enterococcus termitis]OEG10667.1 hypothetical protein BCR25_09400 [Enterococcus termitis]
MNKLAFLVIALLFILGNFYIGRKVLLVLTHFSSFKHTFVLWGLIVFFTLASLLTMLLFDNNVGRYVGKIGSYWLGVWFLAVVIFGCMDLLLKVVGKITQLQPKTIDLAWLSAVVVVAVLFFYGSWHAQQIQTKRYNVTIDSTVSDQQQKMNVVMISDVHLGYVNDEKKLKKIVNKINQLKPDVVFIAGDLFDGNYQALQNTAGIKRQFERLESTYGTYMCWGNHDAGETFEQMKTLVEEAGIMLLEDKMTVIGEELLIVGRKDSRPIGAQDGARKSIQEPFKKVGDELPKIILDHQPSNIDEYHQANELILSGHTHQGQIFPFSLVTNAYFTVDYGYYRKNEHSPQVIVSSGVGTWGPPLRIGTQSEIVQIELTIN